MKVSVGLHLSNSTLGPGWLNSVLDATGLANVVGNISGFGAAPAWLMSSLDSVEVSQSDRAPNGFQLVFTTPRSQADAADFRLFSSTLLIPGRRVIITAAMNGGGSTQVLMDGVVTRVQMQTAGVQEEARITIIGEDLSTLMDLFEYSLEYPCLPDFAVAGSVLLKWMALAIAPAVIPSPEGVVNIFNVSQQVGSDLAYLNHLALQRAYVFCLIPGPKVGENTAYWGPPLRLLPPQPTLTVDSNGFANVITLSGTVDGTTAQTVYGFVQDSLTGLPLPAGALSSTRLGQLAARPALGDSLSPPTLLRPLRLFRPDRLNVLQAEVLATGTVNASVDQVSTATGRLDVLRYGWILTAPGVVGVRGAGESFNGYYYVQKVVHSISRGAYIQEFALTREGLGSKVSSLPVGSGESLSAVWNLL